MHLCRMWALQKVPHVSVEVLKICAAKGDESYFSRIFIFFHWPDVEMDGRFVIYVKNRSRGVFGRSLRVEKYKFEAGSPYFSPPEPLDAP